MARLQQLETFALPMCVNNRHFAEWVWWPDHKQNLFMRAARVSHAARAVPPNT